MNLMWYRFVQLLFRVLFSIFFRLETIGRENIPHEGPVVIASNHVSLLDPPMIGTAASRPIHFMAKSELFVPVHRRAADTHAIRHAFKLLKDRKVLGIFPEGHRIRTGKLGKAEPGAMEIAIKGRAQVVPTAILGSNLGAQKGFWPHIKVVFGQPISVFGAEGGKKDTEAFTEELMGEISRLIKENGGI